MGDIFLEVKQMFKTFGLTKALQGVDLIVRKGEVRGLIGENGSGKSTLSSIVAGVQECDSGEMFINSKLYKPESMVEAQKQGVAMVVQEMGTIPNISVAENIFVGKESLFIRRGLLNKKKMYSEANRILHEIGAGDIEPRMQINALSLEDRKIVEIARAMYDQPDLLIVDETTTALSQRGRKIIYDIINKLKEQGKSVLFISHDLEELMEVCSSLTILRDGCLIGTLEKEQMEIDRIRYMMVGRKLKGDYYRSDFDGSFSLEVVLKVQNVTSNILDNVTIELHKGEILGIGGLTDSGMHELGRLLFGLDKPIAGSITLMDGEKISDANMATNRGLGYVSKNRDQEALMLRASIKDNIVLPSIRKLKKMGLVFRKTEKAFSENLVNELRIKCNSIEDSVQHLSGGNKQKVSFGKWIGKSSDILILDCPTRGIDVGVKTTMYQLIYKLKKEGKSILLISEELSELIGMSDRIIILKAGRINGEHSRSRELGEQDLIKEMI